MLSRCYAKRLSWKASHDFGLSLRSDSRPHHFSLSHPGVDCLQKQFLSLFYNKFLPTFTSPSTQPHTQNNMASSSSPQQPFPYLDDTCILWCTPSDTANIKQWLANQDALFFGSFLNECAKTIDLSGDHWRSKDAGGLTREQSAVYKCLRARPINFEALVAIMQSYAEGKFRRGITKKGVVDLSNSDVGKFCPPPSTALCKTTPSKCKMLFE